MDPRRRYLSSKKSTFYFDRYVRTISYSSMRNGLAHKSQATGEHFQSI